MSSLNIFFLFRFYLPSEDVIHLDSLYPKKQSNSFGWSRPSGFEDEFCRCVFLYFAVISSRKSRWPFVWTYLNFLNPRMVVEICPLVLEKNIFLNVNCQCISLLSLLEKGSGPSFKQSWITFTQGCFVTNLVEIGLVFLERNISLRVYMYFCYFAIISPWKMNLNKIHLNKIEFPN